MKTKKQQHPMPHRTPADMHGDGVYFNEHLLAQKQSRDYHLEQLKFKVKN